MRLSVDEVTTLKDALFKQDVNAKLYLFGSRVDDNKQGGDIDLLIVSDQLTKKDLRQVRLAFFERFGEQKIDIVLDKGDFEIPFHKLALERGVQL